ncbi:hypothetical protein B0T13DRAFT_448490 [Neurospora crassa]|nr:hypothetical protein B0T13DRAFT_448490 [Neurospora crassa]
MDRPTHEHSLGNGCWSAQEKSRRPDHAPPVPQTFVSASATSTGWTGSGSQPILITPLQYRAMHHRSNVVEILLEKNRVAQCPQRQYNWVRHPHRVIAGIATPSTPPGQAGLMYDTFESLPVQTQAHAQGFQCHCGPCIHRYSGKGHTERVHLPHPQSEKDFLAQKYAMLSLADTGVAEEKPPISANAPSTTATATPEPPAPANQPQIKTAAAGTIGLTITTTTNTTTGGTTTRTITEPNGTILVPPPISAHPGCELSPQMAAALQQYKVEHVCDYIQAKNLLKDKIINKVLANTQDKLKDLLQKELERMSTSEEDGDVDLLDSDMEEQEDGETGRRQESESWTFAG